MLVKNRKIKNKKTPNIFLLSGPGGVVYIGSCIASAFHRGEREQLIVRSNPGRV
jgi:hypothetical protein